MHRRGRRWVRVVQERLLTVKERLVGINDSREKYGVAAYFDQHGSRVDLDRREPGYVLNVQPHQSHPGSIVDIRGGGSPGPIGRDMLEVPQHGYAPQKGAHDLV